MTLAFFCSSQTQIIIEHSYLGPLCLQFANPPSVVAVKSEIMERTGLPTEDQNLYCNGKKVRQKNKHIYYLHVIVTYFPLKHTLHF